MTSTVLNMRISVRMTVAELHYLRKSVTMRDGRDDVLEIGVGAKNTDTIDTIDTDGCISAKPDKPRRAQTVAKSRRLSAFLLAR